MAQEPIDIFCSFNRQRFTQVGSEDAANFYTVTDKSIKKGKALYPCMGRKHIEFLGTPRFIFDLEPRLIFKTIDYLYVFVGANVYRYDKFYNQVAYNNTDYNRVVGDIWPAYLTVGTDVFLMFSADSGAGRKLFVIQESPSLVVPTMVTVTDSNAPIDPLFIAAFGNRFVVSESDSPEYKLSVVNLGGSFNPATCFTVAGSPLFNQATGKIKQMAVLHGQLYIFNDFTCDVWANIPSQNVLPGVATPVFPWKLNTSFNFDFGMFDPFSLDVDFGMMVWQGTNRNGLVEFLMTNGGQPTPISNNAVNVLMQNSVNSDGLRPFIDLTANGFLYQYEDTVFYRVSAGGLSDPQFLDPLTQANSIEFTFDGQEWHRCIELNGERNRIQQHEFFNQKHLVTVAGDDVIYEMAGDIYYNELYKDGVFSKFPMRYELTTQQIYYDDYSEFKTDYVEIDFVFGDQTFYQGDAPFDNTVFIVDEASTADNPIYMIDETTGAFIITEGSNTPTFNDNHYNDLFKPHIELYLSDDGGVTFETADLRQFSNLGVYRWRMRWYTLGTSRNRVYKLVCVSSSPIVILGAIMDRKRVSGGAN